MSAARLLSSTVKRPRVCLVVGAGAGIGVNVARRFAQSGMLSVLCRRSNQEGLDAAVQAIQADGGLAKGYLLDAVAPGAIEGLVERVEAEVGDIEVAVYNLGAQIGNVPLEKQTLKAFEMGWRLGCESLFRLAKSVGPRMSARGSGCLLVTSATAAVRGNRGQHSHAAAMGGRRMLCQTLGHELGPRGVHVCHFVIDGAVDAPDTLGRMLGAERFAQESAARLDPPAFRLHVRRAAAPDLVSEGWAFESLPCQLRAERGDGLLQPAHVAETYHHVATQHRSVWSNEVDLRPYTEMAWYNSNSAL